MAKSAKIYEYTVKGQGNLPVDMLRYDASWPATEADAHQISPNRELTEAREVCLRTINPKVATGRWSSFGWTVVIAPKLAP